MRRRLHELARARPRFGAKRLHVLLRRDGRHINHKTVHRLYREEGLQLKSRRRRRRAATVRQPRAVVTEPTTRWAMDFMHDVLATGERVRVFTLVDVYTRDCVALEVARSFSGTDVARILSEAGERCHGLPPVIQCDNNGTEFTSTALDHWAYWNRVHLDFSRPGKPVDTSVCEAFNGLLSPNWTRQFGKRRLAFQTRTVQWKHIGGDRTGGGISVPNSSVSRSAGSSARS